MENFSTNWKSADGLELYQVLKEYFDYYNNELCHQGIDHQIPAKKNHQIEKLIYVNPWSKKREYLLFIGLCLYINPRRIKKS